MYDLIALKSIKIIHGNHFGNHSCCIARYAYGLNGFFWTPVAKSAICMVLPNILFNSKYVDCFCVLLA